MSALPPPEERIAALERAVDELTREVRALRRQLEPRAVPSAPPLQGPPAHTDSPGEARAPMPGVHVSVVSPEEITQGLSRYGLSLLASLVLLSALGILIRWAVRAGHFGPSAQLLAGAALTAGFYALGGALWRRAGDGRAFARVVLSLALAATHLIAWGAGPRLHLLPDGWALAVVVLCAVALGVLAHHAEDGTLFAVGVVGALAAPLLAGVPRTPAGGSGLTLYLAAVLVTGIVAVGGRPWRAAIHTLSVALVLYAATLVVWTLDVVPGDSIATSWRPILPVALALVTALATRAAPPTLLQLGLARVATATAAALALFLAWRDVAAGVQLSAVGAGLAATWWSLDRASPAREPEELLTPEPWHLAIDGLLVPLALVIAAASASVLAPGQSARWLEAAPVAVASLVVAAGLARLGSTPIARLRAAAVVIAAGVVASRLPLDPERDEIAILVATLATATGLARAVGARRDHEVARGALFAGWLCLWYVVVPAALRAASSGYTRIPGASWPLATLLVAVVGIGALVAVARRAIGETNRSLHSPTIAAGAALAAWGWLAIAHWWSPLASTTGTIVYEAAVGAALLATAMLRSAAYGVLRPAGLWMLGFAGVHTLVQVWGLENELVKVLVALLVGSVLLATAYLTRRRSAVTEQPAG